MAKARKTTTHIRGGVHCADFIGRDQVNQAFGFSAEEVERLIEKVLVFLKAGATFLPEDWQLGARGALRADIDGEKLIFRPGAIQSLSTCRHERSYLLSLVVRQEYQVWATRFIPLKAQMDVKQAVDGFILPVAFSEFRPPPPGAGLESQVVTVPLEDITEALEKHPAFVILGEPGAGKTTTLQKITYETAYRLLDQGSGKTPLLVRLSQQGELDPFAFLENEWRRRVGTDFADSLASGSVLILADGINELPRGDLRNQCLKAWREFTEDYASGNQVVFTGRERDYDQQLNLPRVRVEPLDNPRITDYLVRNQATGLEEMLDDPRTRLREMARNPFNLCLLTYAYKCNQGSLSNRGRLLEWFVGELFAREERLAHHGWLPRQVQVQALASLAYTMQEQGESLTFPYDTVLETLPKALTDRGEQVSLPPADLLRFGRGATLLDPAVEPDVRFYHHLLQEYFAALELLRRFERGEDLTKCWQASRLVSEMPPAQVGDWDPLPDPPATGWEVTTLLACGLAGDPQKWIEAIRPHNPVLAGRCLDEAGIPAPEAVLERTCADLLADLYNPVVHLRARLLAGFTLGRIGDPRLDPQYISGVKVILPDLVVVTAGKYPYGSARTDPDAYQDEQPQDWVELPAFEIGKWPVTNAEFTCFFNAGGYTNENYWQGDLARRWLAGEEVMGGQFARWLEIWGWMQTTPNWKERLEHTGSYSPADIEGFEYVAGLTEEALKAELGRSLSKKSRRQPAYWEDSRFSNPSQPVVGITWFEARAYCAWLSQLSGRLYRLPSELEWEAAARGQEGQPYPWGKSWESDHANTIEGRLLKPSPVGAYAAAGGAGPFGAEDQAGNVWEWTASLYRPYPYRAETCEDPFAEGERVLRSGSWYFSRGYARCASRYRDVPVDFSYDVGFRVLSPGS